MFGKFEELVVVLIIIMLLFGAKKIPELARSLGSSVREVRKGFNGDVDDEPSKPRSANGPSSPRKRL